MTQGIDRAMLAALDVYLDAALELPPAKRAALIELLRVVQPRVAAELELLLATEGALDAKGFLSGPGPEGPSGRDAPR